MCLLYVGQRHLESSKLSVMPVVTVIVCFIYNIDCNQLTLLLTLINLRMPTIQKYNTNQLSN